MGLVPGAWEVPFAPLKNHYVLHSSRVLLLQNFSLPLPAPVQCRTLNNLRLPCRRMPPSPNVSVQRASCPISNLSGQQGGQAKVLSCPVLFCRGPRCESERFKQHRQRLVIPPPTAAHSLTRPSPDDALQSHSYSASASVPRLLKFAVAAAFRRIHSEADHPSST